MGLVDGKSVIVTGAGSGIGEGFARALAGEGARVAVADIDQERANRVVAAITGEGGQAVALKANVSDRASIKAMIAAAVNAFGRLDVIFNNAGISTAGPFLEATAEDWRRVTDINVLGVLMGTQEAARQFIAQGKGGKIVNTASIVASRPDPIAAIYSASKAAVMSLTRSAAKEFGQHGITVNCISPGFVDTRLWADLDRDLMQAGVRKEPGVVHDIARGKVLLQRVSTPADLTGAAVFLASDRSDYMTGHDFLVDGGALLL